MNLRCLSSPAPEHDVVVMTVPHAKRIASSQVCHRGRSQGVKLASIASEGPVYPLVGLRMAESFEFPQCPASVDCLNQPARRSDGVDLVSDSLHRPATNTDLVLFPASVHLHQSTHHGMLLSDICELHDVTMTAWIHPKQQSSGGSSLAHLILLFLFASPTRSLASGLRPPAKLHSDSYLSAFLVQFASVGDNTCKSSPLMISGAECGTERQPKLDSVRLK